MGAGASANTNSNENNNRGRSKKKTDTSQSAGHKFTYAYLKTEMVKIAAQLPQAVRHKNRSDVIEIEGKRFIFNPRTPYQYDFDDLFSKDEFSRVLNQINDVGIKALDGMPTNISMNTRLQLSQDAIVQEISKINKALGDRGIFWELQLKHGSSYYVDKNSHATVLHLLLPRNRLCSSLTVDTIDTFGWADHETVSSAGAPDDESYRNSSAASTPMDAAALYNKRDRSKALALNMAGMKSPVSASAAKRDASGACSSNTSSPVANAFGSSHKRVENEDDTIDVNFDDFDDASLLSEFTPRIPSQSLAERGRPDRLATSSSMKASDERPVRISVGMSVEVRYRGGNKHYPGTIVRDRGGSYDVDYDDGEKEFCIRPDLIRVLPVTDADIFSGNAAKTNSYAAGKAPAEHLASTEDEEADETAMQLFQADVSSLMELAPGHLSRAEVEYILRSAGGNVDLAAQMLVVDEYDEDIQDVDLKAEF